MPLLASIVLAGCGDDAPGLADECPAGAASEPCAVFRLVNTERQAAGRAPYTYDAALALAAQRHAVDMAENDYFDHVSLDGRDFSTRARDAGYTGAPRSENIAWGQTTAEQAMESWMGSSGHRANILSADSGEIGVGFYENHWVQVFGSR